MKFEKYMTLEVLMYVEYPEVYEFMFAVNKQMRAFLKLNYISLCSGFTNEGLISHNIRISKYWEFVMGPPQFY